MTIEMQKHIWVIFPNQLFDHDHLHDLWKLGRDLHAIWVIEDPAFFGHRKGSPFGSAKLALNPKRIQYDQIVCKSYVQWLREHFKIPIHHILYTQTIPTFTDKDLHVHMFDPVDHLVEKQWKFRLRNGQITFHENPAFIFTKQELLDFGENKKRLRHAAFYSLFKKKLEMMTKISIPTKSMDIYNRERWIRGRDPAIPFNPATSHSKQGQYPTEKVEASVDETQQHIQVERLPSTHKQADVWLRTFVKQKLEYFGPYQDAIVENEPWLFHSGLSIFLNRGLITPDRILHEVHSWYKKLHRPSKKVIASYEGFIRQLAWREYCRLYYECVPVQRIQQNVFGFSKKNKLSKAWYGGNNRDLGIRVVQDAVDDAWAIGYLHHIRRLMVVANYMMLTETHPDRMYDWFMEFALDSYEWVMVFNVYGMASYSDGGIGSYKPYISSSSYLRKMGATMTKQEAEKWDALYHRFVERHKGILRHTAMWRGNKK